MSEAKKCPTCGSDDPKKRFYLGGPYDLNDELWCSDPFHSQPEPAQPEPSGWVSVEGVTFAEFSRMNRARCEAPNGFNHQLSSWSTSDWFTAIMGELGEAANVAKKLNRVRDGIPGNKKSAEELRDDLRKELGDVFVYLDLAAQSLGFNIGDAAKEVFDAKSKDIGYLPAPPERSTK